MMKTLRFLFVAVLMVIALNGCQKDEPVMNDDQQITGDETFAEVVLVDLDALVDEAINLTLNPLKSATREGDFYISRCATTTLDKTSAMKVLTIDFGTGCVGRDGKTRSGKIIVTTESFDNILAKRVKTFNNFFVDGKKIEGTVSKTITFNRENNIRVATITEDITITLPENGGTAHRVSNLTREYLFNVSTNKADDLIRSWGQVEFTRANGVKVTKTIAEANPLVFKTSCHQLVSGVVTFSSGTNQSWTVDYGNGECDKFATITKGDNSRVIKLK